MIAPACQRWRGGRDSYRPAREVIDTRRYEVAPIATDREARAFVEAHHYSGSYPAARARFGLYRRGGELAGVAVVSHPMREGVLSCLPGRGLERAELGRFVLLDGVEANGETWFLARVFELLRRSGFVALVSHSDPCPRTSAAGAVVFGGHVGTIYQAHNAAYLGRATPRTQRVLPDGTVLSARALSKVRAGERGRRYAAELLERHGAWPLGAAGVVDPAQWLRLWVPWVTRPLRNPGPHRYAWGLTGAAKKHLPSSLPYPKLAPPPAEARAA
ncbi:MAG TPA: hypothetical protein VFS43_09690 [Polyangiaceae bacterium]|nr:hypothetical protein [Polyangiaceae bacterium]